jgi:acetyltransferase-like isoleucine patch superfamily enzyme
MIALIIATGVNRHMEALNERYPSPLLPLMDRPFIQHVVEFLVEGGVTRFEFILSHLPERIRDLLGDGARWGSTFRFHLARDPETPYDILKTRQLDPDAGPFLLAHADRLPLIDLVHVRQGPLPAEPVLYMSATETTGDGDTKTHKTSRDWTGWAWVPAHVLASLPKDLTEEALDSHLLSLATTQTSLVQVPETLNIQTYAGLLGAHRAVMEKRFTGLFLKGREADPSVWLSRNVSLHPTAGITPPVYISENCRIGRGVEVGPHAVIGKDCVIDAKCTLTDTIVFPGTYIGEGLELADVIIDKNLLINIRLGSEVTVSERVILGDTSGPGAGHWLSGTLSRAVAGLLLLLFWPVILGVALVLRIGRKGPVLSKKSCVRLPASADESQWRTFTLLSFDRGDLDQKNRPRTAWQHFFFRFLPALFNIAGGSLRFVGVSPRSREDIASLSRDWRALYLKTKAGVVSEAYVNYGDRATEDECYAAEAFYSMASGFTHDLKLLLSYVGLIFFRRR